MAEHESTDHVPPQLRHLSPALIVSTQKFKRNRKRFWDFYFCVSGRTRVRIDR